MESKGLGSKQSVRSKYLAYRNSLTKSERVEKSKRIWENLKAQEEFREAELVLVYMDYRSEVMTTGLVEELLRPESGKRVFAPRVEGMDIAFYEITSMEDLRSGYQGIREPMEEKDRLFTESMMNEHKCLLFMPGAVFDRQLSRMGYGKGFYDRFVQQFPAIKRVGIAFACQVAKSIPTEIHDRKADLIVTEMEIIR